MPQRVLLLITDLLIGGTPTFVRELAIRLHRRGWPVEVACLSPWGPVADQLVAAGVPVEALGARGVHDLGVILRLAKLVRRRRYDVVFSFLVHANAAAAAASMLLPGVRFLQAIQTTQPRPRWHWHMQRLVRRAAECVVVPSVSVAEALRERSGIPPEKVEVVSFTVDPAPFEKIEPWRPDGGPFSIGFIGRLDPVKRIEDLVLAAGLLGDGVHVHIFGEGAHRGVIERLIAERGLGARVTLHGAVARPEMVLGRVGVLVLPSEAEGFGLVLIEAMAAGVPVVATRVPGIVDVVEHGRNGLLVPVARPDELAAAIRRIIDDAALRSALIAAGREDVHRRFSWESVMPRYEAILGGIRGGR